MNALPLDSSLHPELQKTLQLNIPVDMQVAAAWLAMTPNHLRVWLHRHQERYPKRYRRLKGWKRVRVLWAREVADIQQRRFVGELACKV